MDAHLQRTVAGAQLHQRACRQVRPHHKTRLQDDALVRQRHCAAGVAVVAAQAGRGFHHYHTVRAVKRPFVAAGPVAVGEDVVLHQLGRVYRCALACQVGG